MKTNALKSRAERTPATIVEAVSQISRYLETCGYADAIISKQGGAVFRLTCIYDDCRAAEVRAVADERAACAQIAESFSHPDTTVGRRIAAAIRSRP